MSRSQAIKYRFQGIAVAISLAASGFFFWAAAYQPGEHVKPHHAPEYGLSVWLGIIAFFFFALAVWLLFSAPEKKDQA